jgi:hypothetical protein
MTDARLNAHTSTVRNMQRVEAGATRTAGSRGTSKSIIAPCIQPASIA